MTITRVAAATSAAVLLSVALSATSPAGGQGQSQSGQSQGGQKTPSQQQGPPPAVRANIVPQQPTYSMRIDLVTTDVIVRDSQGQFVADLKPNEFEVFEDGIKQDVETMTLFHGGRQFSALTAPPPPAQEGIVLPPPRPTNDAAGRVFIFFIDDLHLEFRNTARIRDLFKRIRKTLVHEGDMFGVVSTGPSSISIDMTYDLKRLDEAMNKIAGNGLRPADILQGGETAEGPNEVRYRAHVAFSTAYELIQNLENIHNRRKAIIYVSDGYDFNPFESSRLSAEKERLGYSSSSSTSGSGQAGDGTTSYANSSSSGLDDATEVWLKQANEFADADLARELSDLTRTANRANVTLYTIDPRGLVGMPDMDETIDQVEWQNYVRKSIDSLRVLAEETGGTAMVNSNDFDKGLKKIDNETSDYYLLGYYSKNPDPFKRSRRIEIKLTRAGLDVQSRKGYVMKKAAKPTVEKPSEKKK